MMTQIQQEKSSLRKIFKKNRLLLSVDDWEKRSRQICNLLLTVKPILKAKVIHIYWPLVVKKEVDTRIFIQKVWEQDVFTGVEKQVVMPVVQSFSGRPALKHRLASGRDALVPNKWGILEPAGGRYFKPSQIDVVIVPALGAGLNGHRIGQGRGYYDSFLCQTNALKIGLIFDTCLINSVPAEQHDIPLDVIITANKIHMI